MWSGRRGVSSCHNWTACGNSTSLADCRQSPPCRSFLGELGWHKLARAEQAEEWGCYSSTCWRRRGERRGIARQQGHETTRRLGGGRGRLRDVNAARARRQLASGREKKRKRGKHLMWHGRSRGKDGGGTETVMLCEGSESLASLLFFARPGRGWGKGGERKPRHGKRGRREETVGPPVCRWWFGIPRGWSILLSATISKKVTYQPAPSPVLYSVPFAPVPSNGSRGLPAR